MSAAAACLLTTAAGIALFRTELFLASLDVGPFGSEAQADEMVDALREGHGAPEAWRRLGVVELSFRGEIPFIPARLSFGGTSSNVTLRMRFRTDQHGEYHYWLRDGEDERSGAADTRRGRDGLGLLLDSVRHLFELPLVAREIPLRRGLPAQTDGSKRAFFTWGDSLAPNREVDQVVLSSMHGRLFRMDTTGRDIAPFILARVDFEGEVALRDVRLSRRATIRDPGPDGDLIHRWELTGARVVAPMP